MEIQNPLPGAFSNINAGNIWSYQPQYLDSHRNSTGNVDYPLHF